MEIRFRIEPLEALGNLIPIPGEVVRLDEGNNFYSASSGGSLVPSIQTRALPPVSGEAVTSAGGAQIRDAEPRVVDLVPDYLDRQGTAPDVAAWARLVTKGAKTDYEKASAIKAAIESQVKYNLNAAATPTGVDPVSHFLFTSREGYCDVFASSMTLMARSVGLPARYVTGFYPFNSEKDESGRYIIRQRDAHAWCEILFRDAGWVVFDATEGAESVPGQGLGTDNDRPLWQRGWFRASIVILAVGALTYGFFWALTYFVRYRKSALFSQKRVDRAAARFKARIGTEYLALERNETC